MVFLSPSLLSSSPNSRLRLAHEISHAWFGLHIGARIWTEEWISEGFATYCEDRIDYLARVVRHACTCHHIINSLSAKFLLDFSKILHMSAV